MGLFDCILILFLAGVAVAVVVVGIRASRDLGGYLWNRYERTLPAVEPERVADPGDEGSDRRAS